MEEYTHYGKQADVFKHLVLCEVLSNEMPTVYIDTNSANALYQLEHTPEQDYGIYHFLQKASTNDKLKGSLYHRLESDAVKKGGWTNTSHSRMIEAGCPTMMTGGE